MFRQIHSRASCGMIFMLAHTSLRNVSASQVLCSFRIHNSSVWKTNHLVGEDESFGWRRWITTSWGRWIGWKKILGIHGPSGWGTSICLRLFCVCQDCCQICLKQSWVFFEHIEANILKANWESWGQNQRFFDFWKWNPSSSSAKPIRIHGVTNCR